MICCCCCEEFHGCCCASLCALFVSTAAHVGSVWQLEELLYARSWIAMSSEEAMIEAVDEEEVARRRRCSSSVRCHGRCVQVGEGKICPVMLCSNLIGEACAEIRSGQLLVEDIAAPRFVRGRSCARVAAPMWTRQLRLLAWQLREMKWMAAPRCVEDVKMAAPRGRSGQL